MINAIRPLRIAAFILTMACLTGILSAAPFKPPKNPAKIEVEVAPGPVAPGAEATVTVRLEPIPKVKIARYPQIKLRVAAQPGLVLAAEAAIGDARPPAPEELENNYWSTVDELVLKLQVDPEAESGLQEVDAKLKYNYCVGGSYCAPVRVPLKIKIDVE